MAIKGNLTMDSAADANPEQLEKAANADWVKLADDPFGGAFAKPTTKNACGPCDASVMADELAHSPRRYGTAQFAMTVTADDGVSIAENTGSPLAIFEEGLTENGDEAGFTGIPLTRAETDAFKGGWLVGSTNENFRLRGIGIHIGRPYRAVAATTGKRTYETFWSSYLDRLQAALMETCTVSLHYAKDPTNRQEITFELGRLAFHPPQAGIVSSEGARVGNPLARAYIPLTSPAWSGVFDDPRALTVKLTLNRDIEISGDALNPVAAAGADAYEIPVTVELYGHSVETNEGREETRGEVVSVVNDLIGDLDVDNPEDRAILKRLQAKLRGRKG